MTVIVIKRLSNSKVRPSMRVMTRERIALKDGLPNTRVK